MPYPIPDEIFKTHTAVTGKTGAGKSVTIAGMIERSFVLKRRVCVIDPKGDYWGLRYAADGKKPGLPIYLFGDFKRKDVADVTLNPRLGKEMAKLVAESSASYVLGFRGWTVGDTIGFYIDFTSTLFNSVDSPLLLFIDEMQNYAPKGKILSPQAALCIHWSNKIMSEGRGNGLSVTIATQRPQKVHNDTLDCAETLVALRSVHPRARQAISEWMDGHGDPEKSKEILSNLAGMKRGEAYVWSPENELMKRVSFPMIWTYDSYKPPTEADRKLKLKSRAEVNLDVVKEQFSSAIKEQKANDPSELKRKVAEMERTIRQLTAKGVAVKETGLSERDVEIAVKTLNAQMSDVNRKNIQAVNVSKIQVEQIRKNLEALLSALAAIETNISFTKTKTPPPSKIHHLSPPPRQSTAPSNPDGIKIKDGAKRMLAAVVEIPGLTAAQAKTQGGIKNSSTWSTYKTILEKNGLWEERSDGRFYPTEAGYAFIGNSSASPRTTDEVLSLWLPKFKDGARRMLKALVAVQGRMMLKEILMEEAQIGNSSTFSTYITQLKTAHLVVEQDGGFMANKETLFL